MGNREYETKKICLIERRKEEREEREREESALNYHWSLPKFFKGIQRETFLTQEKIQREREGERNWDGKRKKVKWVFERVSLIVTISSQKDPFLEQLLRTTNERRWVFERKIYSEKERGKDIKWERERERESNKETRFGHEPNDSILGSRKLQRLSLLLG